MNTPSILVRHPSASEYARMLRERYPDLCIEIAEEDRLGEQIARADIMLSLRFPAQCVEHAKGLRWFQATGAGVDSAIPVAAYLPGMVITNARGMHGDVIADYVLTGIAMLKWNVRQMFIDQADKRWVGKSVAPLSAMTIGIIGLGAIGGEISRRAKSAGMTVIGFRKNVAAPTEHVDEVYSTDSLREVLGRCDAVVLAVPKTPHTVGMIGLEELASMKRDAVLLNISRGDIIREKELIDALQSGTIGGAMLDVFQQEPLPQDNPLWEMSNVIVTPHMAGGATDYIQRMLAIFCDNLDRFRAGQPLRNVIDPMRGY
jgi:phosphoglycerate dehydrogenase-like enzyme